jgi:hypothetical protein
MYGNNGGEVIHFRNSCLRGKTIQAGIIQYFHGRISA